ncbi:MAG: response regulator [Pseudomonadota bacterium]|nr:response regulator [Pseudomonadota bacterium]
MSFALYQRPGGVVFLDDDRDYLEMLAEVMPPELHVRLFTRPVACIELLQQECQRSEADLWSQQEIISRWREGAGLIGQILQYWREDGTRRLALMRVCVVDYAMPAMSGLRVLGELTQWSGSRILLTGRADEQLAVSAFNRGLIKQFIPKQTPDIGRCLLGAIQSQRALPDERYQQIWRATLSREQHALLCDPPIAQALAQLVLSQDWTEHVVIGAPFGVLGLNAQGAVSWLQLEPAANLPELAEMAESQGWEAAIVQDIREGQKLIDLELQLALGGGHRPEAHPAWVIAGSAAPLYAALFPVPEAFTPGAARSYAHFIGGCGERSVQD